MITELASLQSNHRLYSRPMSGVMAISGILLKFVIHWQMCRLL